MLDRAKAVGRHAQLHALAERIGNQRDVLQVRKERAVRLVVGVGNVVTHLPALAGQLANPRHGSNPDFGSKRLGAPGKRRPLAAMATCVNLAGRRGQPNNPGCVDGAKQVGKKRICAQFSWS